MKIYIGIDPGQTGAMGILQPDPITEGEPYLSFVYDCPETIKEMGDLIGKIHFNFPIARAVIEKVNAFYKSSAKSAFTFGGNFSAWQMALACFKIPYEFVTPRGWQKVIYDSAAKIPDPKKKSFERASRLFPDMELKTKRGKILDGRCDALLIAEYCRRMDK